jgi:hypothetical protein
MKCFVDCYAFCFQEFDRVVRYVGVKTIDNWLEDITEQHTAHLTRVVLERWGTSLTLHLLTAATVSSPSRTHVTLVLRSSPYLSVLPDLLQVHTTTTTPSFSPPLHIHSPHY